MYSLEAVRSVSTLSSSFSTVGGSRLQPPGPGVSQGEAASLPECSVWLFPPFVGQRVTGQAPLLRYLNLKCSELGNFLEVLK